MQAIPLHDSARLLAPRRAFIIRAEPHTSLSATACYHELVSFCGTVALQSELAEFPFRSVALDLLSIYAFGAVLEMQRTGRINIREGTAVFRRLLCEFFGCSEKGAARREKALHLARNEAVSRFHWVMQRGGNAFLAWQLAPATLNGADFRSLLESLRTGSR